MHSWRRTFKNGLNEAALKGPGAMKSFVDYMVAQHGPVAWHRDLTVLLAAHIKSEEPNKALNILLEMEHRYGLVPHPNSFSAVITAYAKLCTGPAMCRAQSVYRLMLARGVGEQPTCLMALLSGYCRLGDMDMAERISRKLDALGHPRQIYYYTAMIAGYCKARMPLAARRLYDELTEEKGPQDAKVCVAFLQGLARNGLIDEAAELLEEMASRHLEPDEVAMNNLIAAAYRHDRVSLGVRWASMAQRRGFILNEVTASAIAARYAHPMRVWRKHKEVLTPCILHAMDKKKGPPALPYLRYLCTVGEPELALEAIEGRVGASYRPQGILHTLLLALGRKGLSEEAERAFALIQRINARPTDVQYKHLITAYAASGKASGVRSVVTRMREDGFEPGLYAYRMLIRASSKSIPKAERAFKEALRALPAHHLIFAELIRIYMDTGHEEPARQVAQHMLSLGVVPRPTEFWRDVEAALGVRLLHVRSKQPSQQPDASSLPANADKAANLNNMIGDDADDADDGQDYEDGHAFSNEGLQSDYDFEDDDFADVAVKRSEGTDDEGGEEGWRARAARSKRR